MIQAAEEITQQLLSTVQSDKPRHSLKELQESGYPAKIIKRMHFNILKILSDELRMPASKWINPENAVLQKEWDAFMQTAGLSVSVPDTELYDVTKVAVNEVLQLYLNPQQYLTDFLFGDKSSLNFQELNQRIKTAGIQNHFARAIPLYMQKRQLTALDKNRCNALVQKLDANLTADYSSEEWLQSLEPVFVLSGGTFPAEDISGFFKNKNQPKTAAAFLKRKGRHISRKQFLEILESVDESESNINEAAEDAGGLIPEVRVEENEPNIAEQFSAGYDDELYDNNSLNALFRDDVNNAIFRNFEEENEPEDEQGELNDEHIFQKKRTSESDMAADSFRPLSGKEEDEKEADKNENASLAMQSQNKIPESVAEESDEPVIWQQYADKEKKAAFPWEHQKEDEDDGAVFVDEDDILEENEPLFASAVREREPKNHDENIRVYLMGQEVFFIEEIFGGNEKKYVNALNEIDQFNNWEKAADYIQDKIFKKNKVDILTEAAVDFTDTLQSYFQEYKI